MKTFTGSQNLCMKLCVAFGLIIGMSSFSSLVFAERLSLTGLKAQIDGVESQVESIKSVVCGDADLADCEADFEPPSMVERIMTLEAEKEILLAALCSLAAQTGAVLPECGPIDGALRIVDGANADEGRLELFYNNQWGTVCDDRWDFNDATVACNQLGYPGAAAALFTFNVVDGAGPILLDDVQCLGTEANLLDCVHREPVGSHNCSHFEDAGVRCNPIP